MNTRPQVEHGEWAGMFPEHTSVSPWSSAYPLHLAKNLPFSRLRSIPGSSLNDESLGTGAVLWDLVHITGDIPPACPL